jgi:type I restriction enzyme M protein
VSPIKLMSVIDGNFGTMQIKSNARINSVADALDQSLHNTGVAKSTRHKEIIKLVMVCAHLNEFAFSEDVNISSLKNRFNEVLEEIKLKLKIDSFGKLVLNDVQFEAALNTLSGLDKNIVREQGIQDIFMRFGPQFLRKDLDQYFTPKEVVDFMAELMNYKWSNQIIDPAGGSGDFLVAAGSAAKRRDNVTCQLFHWDLSVEASEVAQLNLLMNGWDSSKFKVGDSIEEHQKDNGKFGFVLTNPPFGTKTIWSEPNDINVMANYHLGHKWSDGGPSDELVRQQLGLLFVERGLSLLKEHGVMAIVLPSGYLTNPSEKYFRKFLFEESRVLGVVSLPAGTFKKSGAGVTCEILIVQKIKTQKDYEIFVGQAKRIGFDFKKSSTPRIYKRDPLSGLQLLDGNAEPIPDNDLESLAEQFKAFAQRNKVTQLNQHIEPSNSGLSYQSVRKSEILEDPNLVISPKRYSKSYIEVIDRLGKEGFQTLGQVGAEISITENLVVNDTEEYIYLDIGEIGLGTYKTDNILRGWELPGRARQRVSQGDILVARLSGSSSKFCMITSSHTNLIATNGLFRVRIEDERERLKFYHFLYSREMQVQIEALSTGSIMEDIKLEDFRTRVIYPSKLSNSTLSKMQKLVDLQTELFEI